MGRAPICPHCNFLSGVTLADFCRYVLSLYHSPNGLARLAQQTVKASGRPWVSDMALFKAWSTYARPRLRMLEDAGDTGVHYDSLMRRSEGMHLHCQGDQQFLTAPPQ